MFMHRNLPVNFAGGLVSWRLYVLHYVAKALGLLVKVEGFPYGTRRNICDDREPCCGVAPTSVEGAVPNIEGRPAPAVAAVLGAASWDLSSPTGARWNDVRRSL